MNFFDVSGLTPHGFCLAWQPGLLWLEAASDLLIAAAYFSIPAALVVFLRWRQDLAYKPVFVLFAAFIMACGTTHILGTLTLWVPLYWLDGGIKAITALLSVATAIMLWRLMPRALALPSPDHLSALNAALAREVRQRDVAAAMLRDSEARQRRLYASTPAALHATDADGFLVDVSDRWLALLGYAREEVIGRRIAGFYVGEDAVAHERHLAEFRAGQGASRAERRMLCRDGQIRNVEVNFELERDDSGQLLRVLAAVTDITARKQAESALRATEDHLRHAQKMEAVGQLTGGIAHDFNNLLTTIMGSLELLQRREGLDSRGTRLIGNALEGTSRAARLTSQLLSFSRRQHLEPEALPPQDVVDGIAELLGRTLGDRIALNVVPPDPGQWKLFADRNQVESALLNLVINARDAIDGAGRVSIAFGNRVLGPQDSDAMGPDPLVPGDYVSITVTDNGSGMTDTVRDRAFEPFFTTKPAGAGTGLGLSQTYGFVSQSGGTVRLHSRPGAGTAVEILLPRAPGSVLQQQLRKTVSGAAPPGHGEQILMVEDDDQLRLTMSEALEGQGYRVVSAPDGNAALEILDREEPLALLFTDVLMPGSLNGVELAMAARRRRPDLKVIFATGYSQEHMFESWTEQLDLLPKPYSLDLLAARIADRLR